MLMTAYTKVVSVIIYDPNESGDLGPISGLGITLLLITFGGEEEAPCRRLTASAPDTTAG